MSGHNVLGWYSLDGVIYLNLRIANDPTALASTINHESTHELLAATTPYGFVQEALQITSARSAVLTETSRVASSLQQLMFDASRVAQEATATYAGLVDYEDCDLQTQVDLLPVFYRRAYALFEMLLDGRSLSPLARYRIVRAVGARALQTEIRR